MTNVPLDYTPPSSARLVKATAGAAVVAAGVLIFAVLPAEYGIDPTGVGRVLGLTAMGTQKTLSAPAPAPTATAPAAAECVSSKARTTIGPDGARTDEFELSLPPKRGAEIKAFMNSGEELVFEWYTGGTAVYFDFHGEAYDAPKDVFTSYETGTQREGSGRFRPSFDGRHGWFWRNDTDGTVVVRLRTNGGYEDVRAM